LSIIIPFFYFVTKSVYVSTLEKKIPKIKFNENRPVVFALIHANGRTDGRTNGQESRRW